MKKLISELFSENELITEFSNEIQTMRFPASTVAIKPGQYIRNVPIVLSGVIKVLRINENGDELFLYYIGYGESCAESLAKCIRDKPSNIKAVIDEDVELLVIPAEKVKEWFSKYGSWQQYVLKMLDLRYDEIIHAIDNIAFKKVDSRLIDYLLMKSNAIQSKEMIITHQEIATELATSREVVSRLLKTLEQEGKVKLFRNKIEIISLV